MAGIAVSTIMRVLETEFAFPAKPAIRIAAQANGHHVRALIEPLHAGLLACPLTVKQCNFCSGAA